MIISTKPDLKALNEAYNRHAGAMSVSFKTRLVLRFRSYKGSIL